MVLNFLRQLIQTLLGDKEEEKEMKKLTFNHRYQTPHFSRRQGNPVMREAQAVQALVVHHMMLSRQQALDILSGNSRYKVSAHAYIDTDGTVFQFMPWEYKAWHAGRSEWQGRKNLNDWSIGIELELPPDSTEKKNYSQVQLDTLVALCKELKEIYPISPGNLTFHKLVATPPGRKVDPYWLDLDWLRDQVYGD